MMEVSPAQVLLQNWLPAYPNKLIILDAGCLVPAYELSIQDPVSGIQHGSFSLLQN